MTSAGGGGAMAAAPGPRTGAEAEAEAERRRLLRAVTRLQACARGFLLRRQLRSVREEFEAVVLEIEGDLRQLRWSGRVLQRPRFGPEDCPGPAPAGFVPPGAARPRGRARGAQPSASREAAENETIPKNPWEKPDPGGAELGGSWGSTPSPSPLPRGTPKNPPNFWGAAAHSPEEELGASPGIPEELQGLPRWELQLQREQLLLELLWIQQAMDSRKQFLRLKQKLGVPHHPCSIPQFLHCCGGALELQQQQQQH